MNCIEGEVRRIQSSVPNQSMHEDVSLHTGNARSKQNYQYTFADGQHRMQTYHFEEPPLAQMPNYHNSNPYLL
jgi:hypothetical protein